MIRGAPNIAGLLVLMVACVVVEGQAHGRPGQARPAAEVQTGGAKARNAPTGTLRGSVTAAGTGVALGRAVVVLTSESRESRATSTDLQGRYEFRQIAAGSYSIRASKAGFATFEYGQRRTHEGGKRVDLADGQVLERIDIQLPKGAAIAGRLFDDLGEPIEHVRVAAMRSVYLNGRRQLVPVGSPVRTNDLGQYRIHGLPPGTYYVGTPAPTADSGPRAELGRAFYPTYYPGTSSLANAQPVTLVPGQERRDIEYALVAGRPLRISGTVVDRLGRPAAGFVVLVQSGYLPAAVSVGADGHFRLENLPPGEYTLSASTTSPQTEGLESAAQPVALAGVDLEHVILTLAPAVRVSGRIRVDPPVPLPFSQKTISISPHNLNAILQGRATIGTDWTFEIKNVLAGPTSFTVAGLPPGWALRAVVYGGRDVTDTPIDIRRDLTGLEIVLTNRLTEISGTVTDAAKPISDYTVVAFAEDAARWDTNRYVATVRPDQNGRFSVRGLPAGKYLVVAVDDVGDAHDPEYLENLRGSAQKVTLGDGETKVVELKLVRN